MESSKLILNKKAQIWGTDLIVAIIIFLAGIIILYVYAINYNSQSKSNLDELFYEGNLASELILSDQDFGILTDSKINQTKLNDFHDNYNSRKVELGVRHDFYFILPDLEINSAPADYAGKINSTTIEDLIQINRIAIYENKPVKFQLYTWE